MALSHQFGLVSEESYSYDSQSEDHKTYGVTANKSLRHLSLSVYVYVRMRNSLQLVHDTSYMP